MRRQHERTDKKRGWPYPECHLYVPGIKRTELTFNPWALQIADVNADGITQPFPSNLLTKNGSDVNHPVVWGNCI